MNVAFYSYKGGVGRTRLMTGVSARLMARGLKVGLLDFDFDASSLPLIFEDDFNEIGTRDLIHVLFAPETNLANVPAWCKDKTEYVCNALGRPFDSRSMKLVYLPTIANPAMSSEIDLKKLRDRGDILGLFDTVKNNVGVDHLIVDIKPGFSESSEVVLPQADLIVVVARLDLQNLRGVEMAYEGLDAQVKEDLLLVANMVPVSGVVDEDLVSKRLQTLSVVCGRDRPDVEIPYDSRLLFHEGIDLGGLENPIVEDALDSLAGKIERVMRG